MNVDWTFGGLWPYEPRWFSTPEGRLHYIDEGPRDGQPVVLLHGNPTWGFLYRNFVDPLVDAGHRVIVPDFLGFGRSDKPSGTENYRTLAHVRRLSDFLDSLDLHNAVIVPQDWGGLGLAWAVANPERVSKLFILNTSMHNPDHFEIPFALKLFRMPGVGELMVKGLGLFHRVFLFRVGVMHRERLTKDVKRAYLAPHSTWDSRTSVLTFPRDIPVTADSPLAEFITTVEIGLERNFRDRPVRVVWAMKDPAFTADLLDKWLKTFPQATVVRLADAGHYLQEDAHERIVPELLSFLAA